MKPLSRIPVAAAFLSTTILLSACAMGGRSPEPPPPDAADEPPEAAQPESPEPEAAELSPELQAGDRVRDIRLAEDPIEVMVGESVDVGALSPTPVDADNEPVDGVPLLSAPLDGPHAVLEDGRIVGHSEGETEIQFAVMVPDRDGQPEPRILPKRIIVRGQPVASIEILPPEESLYVGTAVPFGVEALTAEGDLRTRVDISWESEHPDIASVTEGGFVQGHRPGRAALIASAEGVEVTHVVEVSENPVRSLELSPGEASVRTGDVALFEAVPLDADGTPVEDIVVTYSVSGDGTRTDLGASMYSDGAFVAEREGNYRVVANAGAVSAGAVIEARGRNAKEDPVEVGFGSVGDAPTSDLWVFRGGDGRDYAYTGTHAGGQKMFAWDVTEPGSPVLTDSIVVDARVVNDVKVNEDATLAVITREGASDRRNGIVILDIADPAHPSVLTTYAENLTGGVHNTFIVDDLVYAVHNGTLDIHVVDISNPEQPQEVGRWGIDAPGKYLHDFWVLDGIGYASYWDDGVWILDVGDGRWGGTPTDPVVISSYAYPEGNTHVAFPYQNSDGHNYLFVGDEIFGCEECISRAGTHEDGPRGFVHVISIDDLENPVEVGRYEVPEAGVHNLWAVDDRLYAAYYQAGLRVVDVSGELRGNLYEQGREIAWFPTGHPDGFTPNSPMAWGPQPYGGNVFVSDMNSGLWVVRVEPRDQEPLIP